MGVFLIDLLCNAKCQSSEYFKMFKLPLGLRVQTAAGSGILPFGGPAPRLFHNSRQQIHVLPKCPSSRSGQGGRCVWTSLLERFRHRDVPRLLQGAEMRGHIPVRHFQRIADLDKWQFLRRRQQGHDSQTAPFMDHPVQLEE